MPVVPTYEDRGIRLDPGLNFRDNTKATPEMFGSGIGTALGSVGKGLTDIGQAVSEAAIAREKATAEAANGAKAPLSLAHVENEAAANLGVQRVVAELGRLKSGGDGTQGDDGALTGPVDTFLQYQAYIDKVVAGTRYSLSPSVQLLFNEKIDPIVSEAKKQGLEAQAQARKEEIPKAFWAGASTYQDQAVEAGGDEARYQGFMASGLKEIEKLGFLQRWEPEHAEQVTAAYISDTRKRATLKIAEADPLAALSFSLDHAAELTNADKMALHDAMEPGLKAAMKRESAHYSQANPAPDQFAASNLSPAAYVILAAIGGAGAPAYDAQNGGGRFGDFSKHPGMVGFGGTSTKAGRYGLDGSTWERIVGLTGLGDFSPASQDRGAWALAQKNYRTETGRSLEEDIKAGRWAAIRETLAPTWPGLAKLTDEDFMKLAGWPTSDVSKGASVGGIGSDIAASAHAAPLPPLAPSPKAPTARLSPETEALLAKLPPAQAEELRNAGVTGVLDAEQERARGDAVQRATRADAYRQRIDSGDKTLTLREIEEDVTLTADQKAELRPTWEAKNQEVLETQRNVQKYYSGQLKLDPANEAHRAANDAVWTEISKGQKPEVALSLLNGLIRQTGMVPSQVIREIGRGLASKDPATVAQALQMSQRLMTLSDEAVRRSDGGGAVEKAADQFRTDVDDLGYSPEEAAQLYIKNNDPAQWSLVDDVQVNRALSRVGPQDVTDLFPERAGILYIGFTPEEHDKIVADYKKIFSQEFKYTGDFERAKVRANENFKRIYGVTRVSGIATIMKYPPENFAENVGGSKDWMAKQYQRLLDFVRVKTGDPTIRSNELLLEPAENAAELVAAGRAPIYRVYVLRRGQDGKLVRQAIGDAQHGFSFDQAAATRAQAKADATRDQQRLEKRLSYAEQKWTQRNDQQDAVVHAKLNDEAVRQAMGLPPERPAKFFTIDDVPESYVLKLRKIRESQKQDEKQARDWEAKKIDYYNLATAKPDEADISKQHYQPDPKGAAFGEQIDDPPMTIMEERQKIADDLNAGRSIGMAGLQAATVQQKEDFAWFENDLRQKIEAQKRLVASMPSDDGSAWNPWVKIYDRPGEIGREPAPAKEVQKAQPSPDPVRLLEAVLRQTPTGSVLAYKRWRSDDGSVDRTLDVMKELKDTKYEPYMDEALGIFNRKDLEAWKAQIDMQEEDNRTIEAAGATGLVLSVLAGFLDPTSFVPVGGVAGAGARAALRVGKYVPPEALAKGVEILVRDLSDAGVQEAILQATQEGRSASDGAKDMAKGVVADETKNRLLEIPEVKRAFESLKILFKP